MQRPNQSPEIVRSRRGPVASSSKYNRLVVVNDPILPIPTCRGALNPLQARSKETRSEKSRRSASQRKQVCHSAVETVRQDVSTCTAVCRRPSGSVVERECANGPALQSRQRQYLRNQSCSRAFLCGWSDL